MKSIKTALIATVITMTSVSAFAQPFINGGNFVNHEEVKSISVTTTATSEEAYRNALLELNSLKSLDSDELNKELHIQSFNVEPQSTHLRDGSYVTVQERMTGDGQMEYVGKINVKVHYAIRDNNR